MIKRYVLFVVVTALAVTGAVTAKDVEVNSDDSLNAAIDSFIINSNVNSQINVEAQAQIESQEQEQTEENATQEQARATTNTDVRIEVRGWDIDRQNKIADFAQSRVDEDLNIKLVLIDENSVSITYAVPARILWFFPMTVRAKVSVNADGVVKIQYPWYRFLLAVDGMNDLQAKFASVYQSAQNIAEDSSIIIEESDTLNRQALILGSLSIALRMDQESSVQVR
jgi:hypothetical protein